MLLDENDLFIFDWDGTLVTSGILIRVSKLIKTRYRIDHILRHRDTYEVKSVAGLEIKEETNKIFSIIYGFYSKLTAVRMKDGSEELLRALKEKGKKVCIFSDSNATRLIGEVRKTNVLKYADFVLSADSINRYKPDPSGILIIANKYKTKRNRVVYVGDMASDVLTSRFAGVKACALADGLDPKQVIKQTKPDYFFNSIRDMLDSVNKPGKRHLTRGRQRYIYKS